MGPDDAKWIEHIWGKEPELDEIVSRRFGTKHEKPCANPYTITCALWECQAANQCVRAVRLRKQ